jgi:hypothetical protein
MMTISLSAGWFMSCLHSKSPMRCRERSQCPLQTGDSKLMTNSFIPNRDQRYFFSQNNIFPDSYVRAVGLPKSTLKAWFNDGHIVPFDPGKPGHVATNYSRWFGPEGDQAYPVQYQLRYEPWVFCDRSSIPWHDHLFKGYGLNKVSLVIHGLLLLHTSPA